MYETNSIIGSGSISDKVQACYRSAFLNSFLRGDRDSADRRGDGSVLQALSLMNDNFITSRLNSKTAPDTSLLGISKNMTASQMIDNLYISVLSRFPTAEELEKMLDG